MTVCLDEDQEAGIGGGSEKRLPSLQIRIHHAVSNNARSGQRNQASSGKNVMPN
jgi:hypothetical protein